MFSHSFLCHLPSVRILPGKMRTFGLWEVLFFATIYILSYESLSYGFRLQGCLSPSLLHHALAFFASAYCSDDLALLSLLSHKRNRA